MNVIQNVRPTEFVNLMPQNDYTRVDGLINYVNLDTLERVDNFFEDATVIPWIAKINTTPDMNMTEDDFTLTTYVKPLRKFYNENMSRSHYAIDEFVYGPKPKNDDDYNTEHDFAIMRRSIINGVQYLFTGLDYKWNIEKSVALKDVHIDAAVGNYTVGWVRFNSVVEKDNFANFWYNGKLMNLLLKGLNRSAGSCLNALPKVDWTRPWTDEEILKEFGYTEEEIKEVLK